MPPSLEPMTEAQIAAFVAAGSADYVEERIASGEEPDEAQTTADQQMEALFPDGRPASGHRLFRVVDDGVTVGRLWMGPRSPDRMDRYWVYDIEIDEAHRNRGLGRAAMVLAEGAARDLGADELGLHVFGHNAIAVRLYESLGYAPTSIAMRKAL